jgi:hypothetical protein
MKQWEQPKLIVLVRAQPEEIVLNICKAGGVGSLSSGSSHDACWFWATPCDLCLGISPS